MGRLEESRIYLIGLRSHGDLWSFLCKCVCVYVCQSLAAIFTLLRMYYGKIGER